MFYFKYYKKLLPKFLQKKNVMEYTVWYVVNKCYKSLFHDVLIEVANVPCKFWNVTTKNDKKEFKMYVLWLDLKMF